CFTEHPAVLVGLAALEGDRQVPVARLEQIPVETEREGPCRERVDVVLEVVEVRERRPAQLTVLVELQLSRPGRIHRGANGLRQIGVVPEHRRAPRRYERRQAAAVEVVRLAPSVDQMAEDRGPRADLLLQSKEQVVALDL